MDRYRRQRASAARRATPILGAICMAVLLLSLYGCSDNLITLRVFPGVIDLPPSGAIITITYSLQKSANVTLSVHNQSGRLIRVLDSNVAREGGIEHTRLWNARDGQERVIGAGTYYVLLSAGNGRRTVPISVL